MLKIERHNEILKLLNIRGNVLVTDLSSKFNCSDETIRRDLKELEDKKKLTRTHGGAFLTEKHDKSYPSGIRKILYKEEKISISREAVKYIKDNDFLFLDSSTTCLQLCKEIISNRISVTIVTNSIQIANLCCERVNDIDLILVGGSIRKHNRSTTGFTSILQLENYFADKCFISPPKLSIELGMTDNNANEAKIREIMIKRSKEKFLIVDHTKFEGNENLLIEGIENINTIITDSNPNKKWFEFAKKTNNMNIKIPK